MLFILEYWLLQSPSKYFLPVPRLAGWNVLWQCTFRCAAEQSSLSISEPEKILYEGLCTTKFLFDGNPICYVVWVLPREAFSFRRWGSGRRRRASTSSSSSPSSRDAPRPLPFLPQFFDLPSVYFTHVGGDSLRLFHMASLYWRVHMAHHDSP